VCFSEKFPATCSASSHSSPYTLTKFLASLLIPPYGFRSCRLESLHSCYLPPHNDYLQRCVFFRGRLCIADTPFRSKKTLMPSARMSEAYSCSWSVLSCCGGDWSSVNCPLVPLYIGAAASPSTDIGHQSITCHHRPVPFRPLSERSLPKMMKISFKTPDPSNAPHSTT